jgi:hypothetical protein
MGNKIPPEYGASNQILTRYSGSNMVNNNKYLLPCNMNLKHSSRKYFCVKLVSIIYFFKISVSRNVYSLQKYKKKIHVPEIKRVCIDAYECVAIVFLGMLLLHQHSVLQI